jgi:hypothetical protein
MPPDGVNNANKSIDMLVINSELPGERRCMVIPDEGKQRKYKKP